jgi:hypothetical protein
MDTSAIASFDSVVHSANVTAYANTLGTTHEGLMRTIAELKQALSKKEPTLVEKLLARAKKFLNGTIPSSPSEWTFHNSIAVIVGDRRGAFYRYVFAVARPSLLLALLQVQTTLTALKIGDDNSPISISYDENSGYDVWLKGSRKTALQSDTATSVSTVPAAADLPAAEFVAVMEAAPLPPLPLHSDVEYLPDIDSREFEFEDHSPAPGSAAASYAPAGGDEAPRESYGSRRHRRAGVREREKRERRELREMRETRPRRENLDRQRPSSGSRHAGGTPRYAGHTSHANGREREDLDRPAKPTMSFAQCTDVLRQIDSAAETTDSVAPTAAASPVVQAAATPVTTPVVQAAATPVTTPVVKAAPEDTKQIKSYLTVAESQGFPPAVPTKAPVPTKASAPTKARMPVKASPHARKAIQDPPAAPAKTAAQAKTVAPAKAVMPAATPSLTATTAPQGATHQKVQAEGRLNTNSLRYSADRREPSPPLDGMPALDEIGYTKVTRTSSWADSTDKSEESTDTLERSKSAVN